MLPGTRETAALLAAQDAPTIPAPRRTMREEIAAHRAARETQIDRMMRAISEAEMER